MVGGGSHVNRSGVPLTHIRVHSENAIGSECSTQGHPQLYTDFKASLYQRLPQNQTKTKNAISKVPLLCRFMPPTQLSGLSRGVKCRGTEGGLTGCQSASVSPLPSSLHLVTTVSQVPANSGKRSSVGKNLRAAIIFLPIGHLLLCRIKKTQLP